MTKQLNLEDEYARPDAALTVISREQALRLFDEGKQIYLIRISPWPVLVTEREEIERGSDYFQIAKEDLEKGKQKAMENSEKAPVEKLAADLDNFAFDFDFYHYKDSVEDREQAVEALKEQIQAGDIQPIREWLQVAVEESEGESAEKAAELITRLDALVKEQKLLSGSEKQFGMESLNPDKFKIRKFGVSDVIAITAAGKTTFYYVDKEALVKFNGFLAPKAEGSYLILNEGGYQIEGQTDTWKVIDEKNVQEQRFVQLVCEQTKKQKPDIVLHDSGVLVAQTIYGFDSSVMKKIEKFLREQKPELLHHQKFLENGTAERAKESGTEQNYNMIDGCVNNNPKKPRIIGNRVSVLDRLHIKLEERKQKSQPQQLQQQERSRKS